MRQDPHDPLRIDYFLEAGTKKALLVMNVAKQELRKK